MWVCSCKVEAVLLAAFVSFLSPAMLNPSRNSDRNKTSACYKAIIVDKNTCEPLNIVCYCFECCFATFVPALIYIRSHSRDCFHDMKHGILCMNGQDKCNIINILQIINNNGCSSSTSWMILHEFPPLSIFNQLRIPF